MRSSQFVDVFKQGHVVIPIYFLQQFKKLKITMEEFVFLMYLYRFGDKTVFNPSKYSEDLNIESMKILEMIDSLSEKKLIQVDVLKNEKGLREEVILLEGFYRKLSLLMVEDTNERQSNYQSNIYEIIEKEFGRTLSPIEYEIIKNFTTRVGFLSKFI